MALFQVPAIFEENVMSAAHADEMKGMMMKKYLNMLMVAAGFFAASVTFAQGVVFDTAGDPNVVGVRMQVTYPKGFKAIDHMNGYTIKEFSRKNGVMEENLLLQMMDLQDDDAREGFALKGAPPKEVRYADWKKLMEVEERSTVQSVNDTVVDGKPAVLVEMTVAPKPQNMMRYMRVQIMNVYENGSLVVMICNTSGPGGEEAKVDQLYEKSGKQVCRSFFESLKLTK